MIRSDKFGQVTRALARAQGAFPAIVKDKVAKIPLKKNGVYDGSSYSFKYADLADILATVRPALAEQELAISHTLKSITNPNGVAVGYEMEAWLFHGEEFLGFRMDMPREPDPKVMAGLLTYFRRYTVTMLLGIATDEDKDVEGFDQPSQRNERPARAERGARRPLNQRPSGPPPADKTDETQSGPPADAPAGREPGSDDDLPAAGQPGGMTPEARADWLAEMTGAADFVQLNTTYTRAFKSAREQGDQQAMDAFVTAYKAHPKYIPPKPKTDQPRNAH